MSVVSDDEFVRLYQQRAHLVVDGSAGALTVQDLNKRCPPVLNDPIGNHATPLSDDAFTKLFQQRNNLTIDGWAGRDTISALDSLLPPPESLQSTSSIPDSYWPLLAQIESGGRPYIKASTSSASGLYQFTKSTWLGANGSWGSDMSKAFGGLTPSVEEQLMRAKNFTQKNANYLVSKGIKINKATLYAAHFLGSVTAAKILGAAPTARADLLAGSAATKANQSILLNKSVKDFSDWLQRKTGDKVN